MSSINIDQTNVNTESLNKSSSKYQERAKRLSLLLDMTGLYRKDFAKKHSIALSNFQNWVGPRYGGLTEKGAAKVVSACLKEGIEVSVEWLMYGLGVPPVILRALDQQNTQVGDQNLRYLGTQDSVAEQNLNCSLHNIELAKIGRELELFKGHYGYNVLTMVVDDNTMEPYYKVGDYVAGKRYTDFAHLFGSICIVETSDNKLLLRTLKAADNSDSCYLTSTENNTPDNSGHHNVKIISAAPIMWLRRIDITN